MPRSKSPDPSVETPRPLATPRERIVDSLMSLAAERAFEDISISDICERAGVSLSEFRDLFPSKGAVLGAFSRKIDKIVLDGTTGDLLGEPAKERLFDVLMRRLDAMTPYRAGLEGVSDWARRDPLAAAALNGVVLNSMRFMLEASGIDSEGGVGALKLQGLVFAWGRILETWFHDEDVGLSRTMAVMDKELERGGRVVARLQDFDRLASPLRSLARAVFDARRDFGSRMRERSQPRDEADLETP